MYKVLIIILTLTSVVCIYAFGCSQNGKSPMLPPDNYALTPDDKQRESDRVLWGMWEISFDLDELSAAVEPMRDPQLHVNVADMVSPPVCNDCIVISVNSFDPVTRIIDIDVALRNPYPISGRDVRGILYFTEYEHILVNPDDWTGLWNSPGLLEINPFIAFAKGEANRIFGGYEVHAENYMIYVPQPPAFFAIQYAVDASWPGNCKEPYSIHDIQQETINSGIGSAGLVKVTVLDWQDDVDSVQLQAPELTGLPYVELEPGAVDNTWEVTLTNNEGATAGDYQAVVIATSANSGGTALYEIFDIVVSDGYDQGWAQTWGGSSADCGYKAAVDDSGNVYVAGGFQSTVDFDPDSVDVDEHSSNGGYDCFLAKFNPSGNFQWVRTWGGSGTDIAADVAIDGSGNIYVTGGFMDTADLDPGPGDQSFSSSGIEDVFLSKFDDDGNLLWACGWGGSGSDEGNGVSVDDLGDVYVGGSFGLTVDFDPGAGSHNVTSNGDMDAFICKFDPANNFQWVRTWGGGSDEYSRAVATDGSSGVYATGEFRSNPVDFNPDPVEIDTHYCNGSSDIFLSKFGLDGAHEWTATWGGGGPGYGSDISWAVVVDASGNVYPAGNFYGTVDFDPGTGVHEEHAPDGYGSFVSKLNSAGAFIWVSTWDGEDYETAGGIVSIDCAGDIDVDSSGNLLVTGQGNSGTDFDPGPGVEIPSFNGRTDGYLCRFNSSDGSLDWVRVFGGVYYDRGMGCVVDEQANVYVTGIFSASVDFDPGTGVDTHSSVGANDVFLIKFLADGSW